MQTLNKTQNYTERRDFENHGKCPLALAYTELNDGARDNSEVFRREEIFLVDREDYFIGFSGNNQ